ncbi:MAG: PP2C family protein-serine/threonine phosphatase [Terriglobia bacterium]
MVGFLAAMLSGATGLSFFFGLLTSILLVFLGGRTLAAWRVRLLWRLSHRLLVTYVFISIVPILLMAIMVGLAAYVLYGQLAGYLIATDLREKVQRLGSVNRAVSVELHPYLARDPVDAAGLRELLAREQAELQEDFPGVQAVLVARGRRWAVPAEAEPLPCGELPAWVGGRVEETVLYETKLFLHTVTRLTYESHAVLCLTVPLDSALLDTIATDLGFFRLLLPWEGSREGLQDPLLVIEGQAFRADHSVAPATPRPLPPASRFDPEFTGLSKFNALAWDVVAEQPSEQPVLISVTTRASLVNRHVFGTLGKAVTVPLTLLVFFGFIFVVLEAVSFFTGVGLSRTITRAISDLYDATRRIQAGDFAVRVHHRRRDQLGELADSFNSMAASIESLLEESKERQRLESELEIARQVQEQLFPRETPRLATLELVGVCRPARVVSGDYYDYGLFVPGKLVFAIGDISGKGISAALLMATIQAALRSQLYAVRIRGEAQHPSPAALVARLNQQLYETTSSEKYASLFCGFYDEAERWLTYCNAGHMPPVVLSNGRITRLDIGGPVVGLFGNSNYKEGQVRLEPGSLLVAFTDGLTEAENAYGEEFSSDRLLAIFQRNAGMAPVRLAETLFKEVRHWVATAEPADDMTLLVARAR